jgi:hypothetical protein
MLFLRELTSPEIVAYFIGFRAGTNYIARYLIHEKQIYILRVWHHKEKRL